MYEVMARRYRPALFDEVVGQEHIAATLKNAITRDRVAHAFMFTGGHGCGKTTMARILAKALVCQNGPTPNPCGVCPICLDVAAGRDTDVLEIDGASNNGIEQIRLLREQAAYVPTRARYKIYIIDEVHMLSDGAFNALLKTLEEPPRHVKFILATTDPHKVPDTILSRCQRFDFRLVPQGKLAAFFRRLADQEKAAISDEALDAVASFAGGSVRDGLVLLDQLLSFSDGEVQRQDVEAVRGVASAENVAGLYTRIAESDAAGALAIVDEVASRGTNVGDFLDQLISFGRDLMVFVAGGGEEVITAFGPARETLLKLAKTTSLETALLYLDIFTQSRTRVRSRALSNPMVSLEMAVARLAGLGGVTPVSEILGQLAQFPGVNQAQPGSVAEKKIPASALPPPTTPVTPPPPARDKESEARPEARDNSREGDSGAGVRTEQERPGSELSPQGDLPSQSEIPPQAVVQSSENGTGGESPERVPTPAIERAEQPAPAPLDIPAAPPATTATSPVQQPKAQPAPFDPDPAIGATPEASAPDSAAASAAPPQGDLTLEQVKGGWSRILDVLAERHPADIRHILRLNLEEVQRDVITLSGTAIMIEPYNDQLRLTRLCESAAEALGRPVTFTFVERRIKREKPEDNRSRHQLARHPAVDTVRSIFDGVVVDCKTAAELAAASGKDTSNAGFSDTEDEDDE